MNYETKYKQALERASKLRVQNPFDTVGQMVEHIFPELREDDDDRVRKDIIRVFKGEISFTSEKENEKYIAWLEKQGETFTKKDVDDAYLKGVCDAKHEIEKQGEQPMPFIHTTPCYAPDGICTNPQRDCINCPKTYGQSTIITTTET